jgi:hypothetical protein
MHADGQGSAHTVRTECHLRTAGPPGRSTRAGSRSRERLTVAAGVGAWVMVTQVMVERRCRVSRDCTAIVLGWLGYAS